MWEIRDRVLQNACRSSGTVAGDHKGDLWSKEDISERKNTVKLSGELRHVLVFSRLKMDDVFPGFHLNSW